MKSHTRIIALGLMAILISGTAACGVREHTGSAPSSGEDSSYSGSSGEAGYADNSQNVNTGDTEVDGTDSFNDSQSRSSAFSNGQSSLRSDAPADSSNTSGWDNSGNIVTTPPAKYVKQAWETAAETQAKSQPVSTVGINLTGPANTVTDRMFGAGYDGWNDIINPDAVQYLNDIGMKDIRVAVNLNLICKNKVGEYDMEYMSPQGHDCGLGFITRLKKMVKEGWRPIPVFSQGNISLPSFFHGDLGGVNGWWYYDRNGAYHYPNNGNQVDDMQTIARDIASRLKSAGLGGLTWETIYEADGVEHNLPDTHYYTAKGLRQGDSSIKIIGPATWPTYSVEERFIKPYFTKYGAEGVNLLDYVSMHWYASNSFWMRSDLWDHTKDFISMTDTELLKLTMEATPYYAQAVRRARALLDVYQNNKTINPSGKKIGIAFTEYDANAYSPYLKNYNNINYPNYYAKSDTYINTNYFGGVWLASVMTDVLANSPVDIMMKFMARNYYGLIDNIDGYNYYRLPVWYAIKLLRDGAGMKPGAKIVSATVTGPTDSGAAPNHIAGVEQNSPWIQAVAVKNGSQTSVIIINRSNTALPVNLTVLGAANRKMTRYVYCKNTNAMFIGGVTGGPHGDGYFEGYNSTEKYTCIRAINYVTLSASGKLNNYAAPAFSFTVFTF